MKGDPSELASFMAAVGPESVKDFAKACDTTVKVLEALAKSDDPNPSARLALNIEAYSCSLAKYTSRVPIVRARKLCGAKEF